MNGTWRERAPWIPLDLTDRLISRPGARDPKVYVEVARQFDVVGNVRYHANTDAFGLPPGTYCNIFVWDVTRAMGAEVPHWVDFLWHPAPMGGESKELDANAVCDWLAAGRGGWRRLLDSREAYAIADTGRPVVAGWRSPIGRIGHVAMVMPGDVIAQAGRTNLWLEPIARGFGGLTVAFYGHD